MPAVNLSAFDLNLLLVFDAIMQERSVTRAGSRVGLSQPAMSHALSRLRQQLDDELFVRTPTGMEPTPRAEQLAGPLRDALAEVRLALEPAQFDAATAQRRFTIAINNYAAILLAPRLVSESQAQAPHISFDLRPRGGLDLPECLDRGDLDLAIDAMQEPAERFAATALVEDEIVLVMRRGHPVGAGACSAAGLAALQHLDISSPLDDTAFIDGWFARQGLTRNIALRAPFHATPQILAQSDMVASMSRRIAEHLLDAYPLQVCEPPYASPPVRLGMLWHRRLDSHPAHRWLRGLIRSVASGL